MKQYFIFSKQVLYVFLSIFIVLYNANTISASNSLPVYDILCKVSVSDFDRHSRDVKVKRGFYYGLNKLFYVSYQYTGSTNDQAKVSFFKDIIGLGYRQLTTRYGIIGGYGMLCGDESVFKSHTIEQSEPWRSLFKKRDLLDSIIGAEILTNRYHGVLNFYIPLEKLLNADLYEKDIQNMDIRYGRFAADTSIKFLHTFFVAKKCIPTLGGYLVENSKKSSKYLAFIGIFGKIDYVLSKYWTFNFKFAYPFNSEETWKLTVGFSGQNYNPATYTAYGDLSGASRLLHMPLQHSEVSRFSTP